VSEAQAKTWFAQYCSRGPRKQDGEIVLRASTKEFKGQYPADIRFEQNGGFTLEVTNILGSTMLRITSDGKEMETLVPPKPQYNRQHIAHYLGLDLPILTELLLGDLPCPTAWKAGGVKVEGNRMQIVTSNWIWNFLKSDEESKGIPISIHLDPVQKSSPNPSLNQGIDLQIEDWDSELRYAKKVSVKSPEGELKWTWRNRNANP
jgi:hypothetical protein